MILCLLNYNFSEYVMKLNTFMCCLDLHFLKAEYQLCYDFYCESPKSELLLFKINEMCIINSRVPLLLCYTTISDRHGDINTRD